MVFAIPNSSPAGLVKATVTTPYPTIISVLNSWPASFVHYNGAHIRLRGPRWIRIRKQYPYKATRGHGGPCALRLHLPAANTLSATLVHPSPETSIPRNICTRYECRLHYKGGDPAHSPATDVRPSLGFTRSLSDRNNLHSDQYLGEFRGDHNPAIRLLASISTTPPPLIRVL